MRGLGGRIREDSGRIQRGLSRLTVASLKSVRDMGTLWSRSCRSALAINIIPLMVWGHIHTPATPSAALAIRGSGVWSPGRIPMASDVQPREKGLTDIPDIIVAESWHCQIRRGSINHSHRAGTWKAEQNPPRPETPTPDTPRLGTPTPNSPIGGTHREETCRAGTPDDGPVAERSTAQGPPPGTPRARGAGEAFTAERDPGLPQV